MSVVSGKVGVAKNLPIDSSRSAIVITMLSFTALLRFHNDVNIKIISPRTLGGSLGGSWAADQYVIVGPGFRGSLLSHFDDDHIIRSLIRFSFIVVRTQIYDLDDAPNVAAIQSGYTLAPLAGNEPQKTNMPIFPFMNKDVVHKPDPEAQLFFSYANFIINYMEIEDCT